MAFFINPITVITIPPPATPPQTEPKILVKSIAPLDAAAPKDGDSIPRTVAPSPPPAMPAIEFHNVPIDAFFRRPPARLPPSAPEAKPIIVINMFEILIEKVDYSFGYYWGNRY